MNAISQYLNAIKGCIRNLINPSVDQTRLNALFWLAVFVGVPGGAFYLLVALLRWVI